mgnify:CR=1 FL=1
MTREEWLNHWYPSADFGQVVLVYKDQSGKLLRTGTFVLVCKEIYKDLDGLLWVEVISPPSKYGYRLDDVLEVANMREQKSFE